MASEIPRAELDRLKKLWAYEEELYSRGLASVAGVDEAGRGPLAGPVAAACVMLPRGAMIPGVNDSKKLSAKKRLEISRVIKETAVCYRVETVDAETIDKINILNATYLAMRRAVAGLTVSPGVVLVDGREITGADFKQTAIVGGDTKIFSIAAASVLAKVYRDELMIAYDELYPAYGFAKHKGYGTAAHIEALKEYGPCPIHRRSFIKKFIAGGGSI